MKQFFLIGIFAMFFSEILESANAPISTVGTIVSTGSSVTVPITTVNFSSITSCNLKLLYDPAIISVSTVTTGPSLGGTLTTDLSVPGTISLGWYAFPGITLPDNSVIFNISLTKVTAGTSAIVWSDDGYSCIWYGNFIPLNDIPTSTYYLNGSVTFAGPLTANFTVSSTTPPKDTTVQFTDQTTGGPASWAWSFDRTSVIFVNGTNASSQDPQVQFTESGPYTVTLEVSNGYYSDTEIKTEYIRAGVDGLWTGLTSSAWNATTNWDNWLVPVAATDVVIPSATTFWPVFNGNFFLGTNCRSLTLNGSSQAVINGNFSIGAGSLLNITDNGIFYVSGDWTNAGTFNAGTGTVNFTGSGPSSIISGGAPPVLNTFYNLTISKNGAALTNLTNIVVNGNLTINQ